jgi:hypothetical protein
LPDDTVLDTGRHVKKAVPAAEVKKVETPADTKTAGDKKGDKKGSSKPGDKKEAPKDASKDAKKDTK